MPHWEVVHLKEALKSQEARAMLNQIDCLLIGNAFAEGEEREKARKKIEASANFVKFKTEKPKGGWLRGGAI